MMYKTGSRPLSVRRNGYLLLQSALDKWLNVETVVSRNEEFKAFSYERNAWWTGRKFSVASRCSPYKDPVCDEQYHYSRNVEQHFCSARKLFYEGEQDCVTNKTLLLTNL